MEGWRVSIETYFPPAYSFNFVSNLVLPSMKREEGLFLALREGTRRAVLRPSLGLVFGQDVHFFVRYNAVKFRKSYLELREGGFV